MRVLLILALAAVVVYAVLRLVSNGSTALQQRRSVPGAAATLPSLDAADFEEPAAIAEGPDRGFGILRLTPSQLIFAGNSGRVVTLERLEITGVSATTRLPDHVTAKPVLAVTTSDAIHYFAVNDPVAWERRLL